MKTIHRSSLLIATLLSAALAACSGSDNFKTIQPKGVAGAADCPAAARLGQPVVCFLAGSPLAFDDGSTLTANQRPIPSDLVSYDASSKTLAFVLPDDVTPTVDERTGERFVAVAIVDDAGKPQTLADRLVIKGDAEEMKGVNSKIAGDEGNTEDEVIGPVAATPAPPTPEATMPPPSASPAPETPAATPPAPPAPATPTPPTALSVGVAATVSPTEPVVEISVTNASGLPALQGCLGQKNDLFAQNADGTSLYRVACSLQKSTTITLNAPGASGPATLQINVGDPRVTLAVASAAGGTCDEPTGTVAVSDPATCEFTGKINLAPQIAYDYEVLKDGASLSKGTASWPATPKFFAKGSPRFNLKASAMPLLPGRVTVSSPGDEVEAPASGDYFQVDRDHDHTVFAAEVTGLDGTVVLSNELRFPYVSSFSMDAATQSAPSSWLEHINLIFVHVSGQITWHARHIQRLNYVCASANALNLANQSTDNISTDPGSFRSSKYTDQTDSFTVVSLFAISSDQNRITNPCWHEQIECSFTAVGYDGKTHKAGPFTWNAASSQSQCGK